MDMNLLGSADLSDRSVLLRVDFNVPLENGEVGDDTRIKAALPTINYILDKNAKLIIISHLGRPKGKIDNNLSLKVVGERLQTFLSNEVHFINETVGEKVREKVNQLNPKEILVLENLRFNKGEKSNDNEFAKKLAQLADVFVNDAFGVSHRKHASVSALPLLMKDKAYAGFLLEKELKVAKIKKEGLEVKNINKDEEENEELEKNEKEGKVISKKNEKKIKTAINSIEECLRVLNDLMELTTTEEKKANTDNPDKDKYKSKDKDNKKQVNIDNKKKVVTESSIKAKGKNFSQKEKIKHFNKAIRTLLDKKQKERSKNK